MSIDVAVLGAGNIGISVAYYLKQFCPSLNVVLIDQAQPMSLTSAASGENYRNWWPHETMKLFMDRSVDLVESIEQQSGESFIRTRNGYLLATRDATPQALFESLHATFNGEHSLRHHASEGAYRRALSNASDGVDIVQSPTVIKMLYPGFDPCLETLVHIRRGGSIASHHLGSVMLNCFRDSGGVFEQAKVLSIVEADGFNMELQSPEKTFTIKAAKIVNAMGPFALNLSHQLGVELPVENLLQQKIAFADTAGAVPRDLPFTIDLDQQWLDWADDEREAIAADASVASLAREMPGAVHCRPDGALQGNRIKLGWAYNTTPSQALWAPGYDAHFPEVVLRGAARLQPALKAYYEGFPREFVHYGGYYTMTSENWPLIGDTPVNGYFIAIAMSGFGTMAACAAGELTARWVTGATLPEYAAQLSLSRYSDNNLMSELEALQSRGVL